MGYIPIMPYLRLIPILALTLLVAVVARGQQAPAPDQAPAPAPELAASESSKLANNVLTEAIIKLRLRERIAARITQVVDMLNQKFRLDGVYYKDTGHRLRLQLDLSGLGDTTSTMLQVCDGKVRWDYQKVLNMQTYRRLDITPIFKRLEDPILDDQFRGTIISNLGFGGPEAMLVGLQKTIAFDQFADEVFDSVPTYILGGKWKDRAGLLGPNDRPISPTAPLPPYIPSNVRVFIAKDTLWPYRIEMIGNAPSMLQEDTRQIGPDGRPVGVKKAPPKVDPSKIVLNYTLLPETEIKPGEHFVFATPRDAANLIDETDQFLAQLDQYIQMETTRKKTEAAKGEEPVFPGSLSVPPAGSADPAPPK